MLPGRGTSAFGRAQEIVGFREDARAGACVRSVRLDPWADVEKAAPVSVKHAHRQAALFAEPRAPVKYAVIARAFRPGVGADGYPCRRKAPV